MKYKTMKFASILVASIALLGIAAFGENEGKAQFGEIPTDHYVVTQEVDSVFQTWTNSATIKFPNASTNTFYIGDFTLADYFGSFLTGYTETDPAFTEWIGTNELTFANQTVRFNGDVFMNGVGGGTTPLATEFWNLETGKLDATNGVAYVDFKVYPTNETTGLSHLILTHESMSIGNTSWVEYKEDRIIYNDETYEFSPDANGIARLKDLDAYVRLEDLQDGITFDTMNVTNLTVDGKQVLTGEDDPAFKEVFTNSTLNLLAYDEINLGGSNVVTVTTPRLQVSDSIVVGTNNTTISARPNILGDNNQVGIKAWYYSAISFTTNVAGYPATIYLTDDETKRNTGLIETNETFQSGYAVGDVISLVNKAKYDNKCKITHVNGNVIVVDTIPFESIVSGETDYDDYIVMSTNKPNFGVVSFGDNSYVMGSGNKVYRRIDAVFGRDNVAFGDYAFIGGRQNSGGYASFSAGYQNTASGQYSAAIGLQVKAIADSSFA